MKNNMISRRGFLRKAVGTAAAATVAGMAAGCSAASQAPASSSEAARGTYIPGTYSATANGMSTVTVTMTFDAESITNVELDLSGETENIGQAAKDTLTEQLLSKQSPEIDNVAGATVTTTAVKVAAEACIAQAKGETVQVTDKAAAGHVLDLSFMDAPEAIPANKISQTLDCDVCVVGLGVAGVCAARSAAESGLKVIAVEKTSGVCGRSSQFSFFNCDKARESGIEDIDTNALVNELMTQMSHRADPSILKKWADNCGEAITWYAEGYDGIQWVPIGGEKPADENQVYTIPMGAFPEYDPTVDHERIFSGTLNFRPKGHTPVLQANFDKAVAENGLEAYFDSPARQLIRGEDGRVTGVIFQSLTDDSYTQVNASKGVILATGGFGHNDAMMAYYLPWIHDIIDRYDVTYGHTDIKANYANTGDGQQMGMWIGAQMEPGPLGSMAHGDFGKLGPDRQDELLLAMKAEGKQPTITESIRLFDNH